MAQYVAPPTLTSDTYIAAAAAAQSDVDALETAVGTYAGGADIATDLAAVETNIGTPATVSTETDLFAICAALEARIATLEGV